MENLSNMIDSLRLMSIEKISLVGKPNLIAKCIFSHLKSEILKYIGRDICYFISFGYKNVVSITILWK